LSIVSWDSELTIGCDLRVIFADGVELDSNFVISGIVAIADSDGSMDDGDDFRATWLATELEGVGHNMYKAPRPTNNNPAEENHQNKTLRFFFSSRISITLSKLTRLE
jgi:hypothetical protein